MNNPKNELMQFVGGLVMLAAGLFIFSNKVIVHSGLFGGSLYLGSYNVKTGLVMVPFIIGIVWMFASGASFASKVYTALTVLFIIAVVVLNTSISLMSMSLFDWVVILVLIFGGAGLTAKVLFAGNRNNDGESGRKKKNAFNEENEQLSIDEQINKMKKNLNK